MTMNTHVSTGARAFRWAGACVIVAGCVSQSAPHPDANASAETATRLRIAATNLEDTVVVDCQLPGRPRQLGGGMIYLTPGQLVRATTLDCRTRGGEYTLGDLSGGTLSLKRWAPLAEQGDAEAQYYVARIYANGMSGVQVDYAQAAHWYELAAGQGYKAAEQELGYLYEQGLGVPRDLQRALNLQRKASGLGEALDYAWKVEEAKESAGKQIEELSGRLEAANAQLVQSRSALLIERDALAEQAAQGRRNAAEVQDLRAKLQAARSSAAPGDAARVKDLEAQLASSESALHAAQERSEKLSAGLQAREAELEASMAQSRATSMQLNEIAAARRLENAGRQGETESLRAGLAQANERLILTQQELSDSRVQYQRGVQELAAQRDQIEALSKTAAAGAALLAARQRQLDGQQTRIREVEAQLAASQKNAASSSASGAAQLSQTESQNATLRQQLATLRSEHAAALEQLAGQRAALASVEHKSAAERDAVVQQIKLQMEQQWTDSQRDLSAKEHTIHSLEDELTRLVSDVRSLESERDKQAALQGGIQQTLTAQVESARAQVLELQQKFEKAQTEIAREQGQLLQVQSQLDQERARGAHDAQLITTLNAEIKTHLATITANEELVVTLKRQLTTAASATRGPPAMRSPGDVAVSTPLPAVAVSRVDKYLAMARKFDNQHPGRRFALLIANNNYRHIAKLQTPINDARDLANLLAERYGYQVQLLTDAERTEIMLKLDDYTHELEDNDSLLVYFAGHGDRVSGKAERAYWLGVEADPRTNDGYLEVETIQAKIKQMRARQILLVADSCFSGAIARGSAVRVGRGLNEIMLTQEMSHRARMVLTSGGDAPVPDTGNEAGHSLFATVFIRTLRQNTSVLSGEMLAHEVYAEVAQVATSLHIVEEPTYAHLSDANHDFGDFFFTPQPVLVAAVGRN